MNPFISFCIYVAARVFVQYLKTRPNDQQMTSSLRFLLQAMQALRRRNPLTDSFLAQLDLDLESAGLAGLQNKAKTPSTANVSQYPEYPIIQVLLCLLTFFAYSPHFTPTRTPLPDVIL